MVQHGGNLFFQNACIDFSANINFLGIPDTVMQAARSGLVAAIQYPKEQDGTLSGHVAQWEGVEPEQVFYGNGVSEIARSLVQVLQPKKVLVPTPGFEEYLRPLSMAQCEISYFYTKPEQEFHIPLDAFLESITPDVDLVFFCNPSNPAAVLYDRDFLKAVLEKCVQVQARLVLDECGLDFVEHAPDITMCAGDADGALFIVKDFTKMFAMPGIRLAYGLCTDTELVNRMHGAVLPGSVSAVARRAGIACTKERDFVNKTVEETAKERRWLISQLESIGITPVKGEANYIFFKSRPRLHAFSIMRGIMLRDCSNFEGMPQGYYRAAVRSREENGKLADVLRQWQEQA